MTQPKIFRFIGLIFAVVSLCIWLLQVYFNLTGPVLPYQSTDDWSEVKNLLNPKSSGALEVRDQIITLNGEQIEDCRYLIDSPLYRAPRNVPVVVTYRQNRTKNTVSTNIILANPSPQEIFNRSVRYLMPIIFIIAGIIIIMGGVLNLSHLLVGLTLLSLGLMYAGWQSDGGPLFIFALWGIPISGFLLTVSHAIWPVNQLKRPIVRVMVAMVGLISFVNIASYLPGVSWFGCTRIDAIEGLQAMILWSYQSEILAFFCFFYLILSASHLTHDPFSRLQVRAIAWAVGLGFGIQVIFQLFSPSWSPIGDVTQLLTGIVPITYLFVFYRGELLSIDRYLNRLVYTFLLVIFWVVITLALVKGILFLKPDIDLTVAALIISILSLFAVSFVRQQLGLLVDLALYGAHYDYETVVWHLGQSLAGVTDGKQFAEVVVRQLPQALSIRYAALWLAEPNGQLQLVDSSKPDFPVAFSSLSVDMFPLGDAEVQVYSQPFRVGADPTPWQAILRLHENAKLIGLLLLGLKYREHTYSGRDVRTLQTLAVWIATIAANLAHLANQERSVERVHRLMLALAESERRLVTGVARELHDRGISALGIVRLMVEQDRSKAIITAGLEQVIANLRELSDNQLNPQGLNQGLPQALTAMMETQRQLGFPVSLTISDDYADGAQLSPLVSRELFYIAQEAVVNALKHASPKSIKISLSRPGGKVALHIWNDGRVFHVPPTQVGRETRGMGIMQARADRIGGQLTILSDEQIGTEVSIEIDPNNI